MKKRTLFRAENPLSDNALKEINHYRVLNGLPELRKKLRKCLACGKEFLSLGKRTCGCLKGKYDP